MICFGRHITADSLQQVYYGRYMAADILRLIYYGRYMTAGIYCGWYTTAQTLLHMYFSMSADVHEYVSADICFYLYIYIYMHTYWQIYLQIFYGVPKVPFGHSWMAQSPYIYVRIYIYIIYWPVVKHPGPGNRTTRHAWSPSCKASAHSYSHALQPGNQA